MQNRAEALCFAPERPLSVNSPDILRARVIARVLVAAPGRPSFPCPPPEKVRGWSAERRILGKSPPCGGTRPRERARHPALQFAAICVPGPVLPGGDRDAGLFTRCLPGRLSPPFVSSSSSH